MNFKCELKFVLPITNQCDKVLQNFTTLKKKKKHILTENISLLDLVKNKNNNY